MTPTFSTEPADLGICVTKGRVDALAQRAWSRSLGAAGSRIGPFRLAGFLFVVAAALCGAADLEFGIRAGWRAQLGILVVVSIWGGECLAHILMIRRRVRRVRRLGHLVRLDDVHRICGAMRGLAIHRRWLWLWLGCAMAAVIVSISGTSAGTYPLVPAADALLAAGFLFMAAGSYAVGRLTIPIPQHMLERAQQQLGQEDIVATPAGTS